MYSFDIVMGNTLIVNTSSIIYKTYLKKKKSFKRFLKYQPKNVLFLLMPNKKRYKKIIKLLLDIQ